MKRSFTKEYWLLLGIWAGATLLHGLSRFVYVGPLMVLYPWFSLSLFFSALASALFLLIVIRSGLRPSLLAVGLHLLLKVLVEILPLLLFGGSLTGLGRYLLNILLLYLVPAALYLVLSKLLLRLFRGREWAVFHLLVLLRVFVRIGWIMWSGRIRFFILWDLALETGIMVAVFWLYTLLRRHRTPEPASGLSAPADWSIKEPES